MWDKWTKTVNQERRKGGEWECRKRKEEAEKLGRENGKERVLEERSGKGWEDGAGDPP